MYTESQNTETDLESHLNLKMHNTRIGYSERYQKQATWSTSHVDYFNLWKRKHGMMQIRLSRPDSIYPTVAHAQRGKD